MHIFIYFPVAQIPGTFFEPALYVAMHGLLYAFVLGRFLQVVQGVTINQVLAPAAGLRTEGREQVVLKGTGFGNGTAALKAQYGPYTAANCALVNDDVQCDSVPGVGTGHQWVLTVDGVASAASAGTTSYAPPILTSVNPAWLPTAGGAIVTLTGVNFGSDAGQLVTYGPLSNTARYSATSCILAQPHLTMTCTSVAGVGTNLYWKVTVGGQSNVIQPSSPRTSFMAPTITAVSFPNGDSNWLSTLGADNLRLTGTNLGPEGASLQVKLSNSILNSYIATGCTRVTEHTQVECDTPPGAGTDLSYTIEVEGLLSAPFETLHRFMEPQISNITLTSGVLHTSGGDVAISGTGFGPAGTFVNARFGGATANGFTAACQVQSDSVVLCTTSAGAGANQHWLVIIAGRQGSVSSASVSFEPPVISTVSVSGGVLATTGGTVTLTGSDFGPKGTFVSAGFGPYTGVSCTVTVDHGTIVCSPSAGMGVNHRWVVAVAGQSSQPSSGTTSFAPPSFASSTFSGTGLLATAGGTKVTISGTNFGPVSGNAVSATYGPSGVEFSASNCAVSVAHTRIVCTGGVGTGANHKWKVNVALQTTGLSEATTSYSSPSISSITCAACSLGGLLTQGGERLTITGTNFGADLSTLGVVLYGATNQNTKYTASSCSFAAPHTTITCLSEPGYGSTHVWTVAVDSLESATSSTSTSYAAPSITDVTLAANPLSTSGSQAITITGANLGFNPGSPTSPNRPAPSVVYRNSIDQSYTASGCVASSPNLIVCNTIAGVGKSLSFQVSVGTSQTGVRTSSRFGTSFSYLRPVVSSVAASNAGASQLDTAGSQVISVTGSSFGPASSVGAQVSLEYGPAPNADAMQGSSCQVVSQIMLTCLSSPGMSTGHRYKVTISSQTSDLSPAASVLSYGVPVITGVSSNKMATSGGTIVTLYGNNLGPDSTTYASLHTLFGSTSARYGGSLTMEYMVSSCETKIVSGSSQLRCATVDGIGVNHQWQVTVAGQASAVSSVASSYIAPAITSVTSALSPTTGGTTVTISGTNFGRVANNPVTASYTNADTTHTAVNCVMQSAHAVITCQTNTGVGSLYRWTVYTAGQYSSPSTDRTAYKLPSITGVNCDSPLSTLGGGSITVQGTDLGLQQPLLYLRVTYASQASDLSLQDCTITINHITAVCPAPAGVGKDLGFTLLVGNQESNLLSTAYRYASPVITGVTSGLLDTSSSSKITVHGSGFGPTTTSSLVLSLFYGPTGFELLTSLCYVSTADTSMICDSVPGVNTNHRLKVRVALQSSAVSTADVTVSYVAPTISAVSGNLLATAGGTIATLSGSGFGPLYTSPVWGVLGASVSATYGGSDGLLYQASSCSVTSASQTIKCTTIVGTGAQHRWKVTVGTQNSGQPSSQVSSYRAPSISTLSGAAMPTAGGSVVTVEGQDFGPANSLVNPVTGTYGKVTGQEKSATNCAVTVSHTRITCTSVAGTGPNHYWRVTVGGQESALSSVRMNYAAPSISTLSGTLSLSTAGGEPVTLSGNNFGKVGSGASVHAVYGDSQAVYQYTDNNCAVTVDHVEIVCASVQGVGTSQRWEVTVDWLTSARSIGVTNYLPPIISTVSFPGGKLTTAGGEIVVLTGYHFGPSTGHIVLGSYTPYSAPSCSVATPHTVVHCISQNGVGVSHAWKLQVGGQSSAASTDKTSYSPPSVDSVFPLVGPASGNTLITLTGRNFGVPPVGQSSPISQAKLGSNVCGQFTFSWSSIDRITCRTPTMDPSGNLQPVNLTIGGQVMTSTPFSFSYYEVFSMYPVIAPVRGGTTLSIRGAGFAATSIPIRVGLDFGTWSGLVSGTFVNTTLITFVTLSSVSDGTCRVNISLDNQQFTSAQPTLSFYYYLPPILQKVSPMSGPLSGQTPLQLTGQFYITGALSVRWGSKLIPCLHITQTVITCTTPVHDTAGDLSLKVSIDLVDLQYTQEVVLYQYYKDPVVQFLSPPLGLSTGATSVYLCGLHMITTRDKTRVVLGGSLEGLTVVYDISLNCWSFVTPPANRLDSVTTVSAEIALNGIQFTSDRVNFTYYPQPILTSVYPSLGPIRGTTPVSLSGSGFLRVSNTNLILVQTRNANGVVLATFGLALVNGSLLQGVTAAVPTGSGLLNLFLSLNAQQYTEDSLDFLFYDPPRLFSIAPRSGPIEGNTTLSVTGIFYDTGTIRLRIGSLLIDCEWLDAESARCVTLSSINSGRLNVALTVDIDTHPTQLFTIDAVTFLYYGPYSLRDVDPALLFEEDSSGIWSVRLLGESLTYTGEEFLSFGKESSAFPTENLVPATSLQYQQRITVRNPNVASVLVDHIVRISWDTESRIASGKLRTDCLDLEVRTADFSEVLKFWFDPSSCNQQGSVLWVRLPSVQPSASVDIQILFGHPSVDFLPTLTAGKGVFVTVWDLTDWAYDEWIYDQKNPLTFQGGALHFLSNTLPGSADIPTCSVQSISLASSSLELRLGVSMLCSPHVLYLATVLTSVPQQSWFRLSFDCARVCLAVGGSQACVVCSSAVSGASLWYEAGAWKAQPYLENGGTCSQASLTSPFMNPVHIYLAGASNASFSWLGLRLRATTQALIHVSSGVDLAKNVVLLAQMPSLPPSNSCNITVWTVQLLQNGQNAQVNADVGVLSVFCQAQPRLISVYPPVALVDDTPWIALDLDNSSAACAMFGFDVQLRLPLASGPFYARLGPLHSGTLVSSGSGFYKPLLLIGGHPARTAAETFVQLSATGEEPWSSQTVPFTLVEPALCVLLSDDFELDNLAFEVPPSWTLSTGTSSSSCKTPLDGGEKAAVFATTGTREHRLKSLDTTFGGNVKFEFRLGCPYVSEFHNDDPDVYLQFSNNKGASWQTLETLVSPETRAQFQDGLWVFYVVPLPPVARTKNLMLRWIQDVSGLDIEQTAAWALDKVEVVLRPQTVPELRIQDFTPHSGPVTGGTLVTVIGENFHPQLACSFGEVSAAFGVFLNDTAFLCVSPPMQEMGPVALRLCGASIVSIRPFAFYKVPTDIAPLPRLFSAAPLSVPAYGEEFDVTITITGKSFVWSDEALLQMDLLSASDQVLGSETIPIPTLLIDELAWDSPISEGTFATDSPGFRDSIGLPFGGGKQGYAIKMHAIYMPEELQMLKLQNGDTITAIDLYIAFPPASGKVASFSVTMFEGPSEFGVTHFDDGSFLYENLDAHILLGPRTISVSKTGWLHVQFDRGFKLLSTLNGLIVELTQVLNADDAGGALGYRLTKSMRCLRWYGPVYDGDIYPYVLSIDRQFPYRFQQREFNFVPRMRLYTLNYDPREYMPLETFTPAVHSWVGFLEKPPSFINNISASALSSLRVRLSLALNGQQYESSFGPTSGFFSFYDETVVFVDGISPAVGSTWGHTSVLVTGAGFDQSLTQMVYLRWTTVASDETALAGAEQNFVVCQVVDAQALSCESPSFSTASRVRVDVSINGVFPPLAYALNFKSAPFQVYVPPQLESLTPMEGPAAGNTSITIKGEFFPTDKPGANVLDFAVRCLVIKRAETVDDEAELVVSTAVTIPGSPGMVVCSTPPRPWQQSWAFLLGFNGATTNLKYNYHGRDGGVEGVEFKYLPCPAGQFAPDFKIPCEPCFLGEYAASEGQEICDKCPTAFYQNKRGQTDCEECLPSGNSTTQEPFDMRSLDFYNPKNFSNPQKPAETQGAWYQSNCSCKPDFYRDLQRINRGECSGLCCSRCPDGALCPGSVNAETGEQIQPYPAAGFYMLNSRQELVFDRCVPPEACNGGPDINAPCAIGYTGLSCSICQRGYHKDGVKCVECPKTNVAILIAGAIVAVGFLYLFAMLAPYIKGLGSPRIMYNYMAAAASLKYFQLPWPKIVLDFLDWLSIFAINIDFLIVYPECEIQMDYKQKWYLLMFVPFVIMVSLWFILAYDGLQTAIRLNRRLSDIQSKRREQERKKRAVTQDNECADACACCSSCFSCSVLFKAVGVVKFILLLGLLAVMALCTLVLTLFKRSVSCFQKPIYDKKLEEAATKEPALLSSMPFSRERTVLQKKLKLKSNQQTEQDDGSCSIVEFIEKEADAQHGVTKDAQNQRNHASTHVSFPNPWGGDASSRQAWLAMQQKLAMELDDESNLLKQVEDSDEDGENGDDKEEGPRVVAHRRRSSTEQPAPNLRDDSLRPPSRLGRSLDDAKLSPSAKRTLSFFPNASDQSRRSRSPSLSERLVTPGAEASPLWEDGNPPPPPPPPPPPAPPPPLLDQDKNGSPTLNSSEPCYQDSVEEFDPVVMAEMEKAASVEVEITALREEKDGSPDNIAADIEKDLLEPIVASLGTGKVGEGREREEEAEKQEEQEEQEQEEASGTLGLLADQQETASTGEEADQKDWIEESGMHSMDAIQEEDIKEAAAETEAEAGAAAATQNTTQEVGREGQQEKVAEEPKSEEQRGHDDQVDGQYAIPGLEARTDEANRSEEIKAEGEQGKGSDHGEEWDGAEQEETPEAREAEAKNETHPQKESKHGAGELIGLQLQELEVSDSIYLERLNSPSHSPIRAPSGYPLSRGFDDSPVVSSPSVSAHTPLTVGRYASNSLVTPDLPASPSQSGRRSPSLSKSGLRAPSTPGGSRRRSRSATIAQATWRTQQAAQRLQKQKEVLLKVRRVELEAPMKMGDSKVWLFEHPFVWFWFWFMVMEDRGDYEVFKHLESQVYEMFDLAIQNRAHKPTQEPDSWELQRQKVIQQEREAFTNSANKIINATAMLIMFALLPLLENILEVFSCKTLVGDTKVMIVYPEIECNSSEHRELQTWAIVFLICWIFVMPFLFFLRIRILVWKRELHSKNYKACYGFFYIKYTRAYWFWEFVILLRKSCLVFILVFFSEPGKQFNQVLIGFFIFLVALVAQRFCSPFVEDRLNQLESLALSTQSVVLFIGTIFLTDQVPYDASDIIGIVVCIILSIVAVIIAYFTWLELVQSLPMLWRLLSFDRIEETLAGGWNELWYEQQRPPDALKAISQSDQHILAVEHQKHMQKLEQQLLQVPVLSLKGLYSATEWLLDSNTPTRDGMIFVRYITSTTQRIFESFFGLEANSVLRDEERQWRVAAILEACDQFLQTAFHLPRLTALTTANADTAQLAIVHTDGTKELRDVRLNPAGQTARLQETSRYFNGPDQSERKPASGSLNNPPNTLANCMGSATDASFAVVGYLDGTVELLPGGMENDSGRLSQTVAQLHQGPINALLVGLFGPPDQQRHFILTCSGDGLFKISNDRLEEVFVTQEMIKGNPALTCLALTDDFNWAVAGATSGHVIRFDLRPLHKPAAVGPVVANIALPAYYIHHRVFDNPHQSPVLHLHLVSRLRYLKNASHLESNMIAAYKRFASIKGWEADSLPCIVVSASPDGTVRIWDLLKGIVRFSLQLEATVVDCVVVPTLPIRVVLACENGSAVMQELQWWFSREEETDTAEETTMKGALRLGKSKQEDDKTAEGEGSDMIRLPTGNQKEEKNQQESGRVRSNGPAKQALLLWDGEHCLLLFTKAVELWQLSLKSCICRLEFFKQTGNELDLDYDPYPVGWERMFLVAGTVVAVVLRDGNIRLFELVIGGRDDAKIEERPEPVEPRVHPYLKSHRLMSWLWLLNELLGLELPAAAVHRLRRLAYNQIQYNGELASVQESKDAKEARDAKQPASSPKSSSGVLEEKHTRSPSSAQPEFEAQIHTADIARERRVRTDIYHQRKWLLMSLLSMPQENAAFSAIGADREKFHCRDSNSEEQSNAYYWYF